MSTRTVFRGSHGRWAGSSGGRAEKVRVGTRSVSGSKVASKSAPASKTAGVSGARTQPRHQFRSAAVRQAKSAGRKGLKAAVTIGVVAGTAQAARVVVGGGFKTSPTGMVSLRRSGRNVETNVLNGKTTKVNRTTGYSVNGIFRASNGKRTPAGSILSQPNYAAAKGFKENLRVREVPLTMGSVNGVPVGSRAARPGR